MQKDCCHRRFTTEGSKPEAAARSGLSCPMVYALQDGAPSMRGLEVYHLLSSNFGLLLARITGSGCKRAIYVPLSSRFASTLIHASDHMARIEPSKRAM